MTWRDGELRSAANNNELDKVVALLHHGARHDTLGRHGESALHTAIRLGHREIVVAMLAHQCDLGRATSRRETAITLAAIHADVEMLSLLLAARTEPESWELARALSWAIIRRDMRMAERLVHAGADVNARSATGKSILQIAQWWRDEATVQSFKAEYQAMVTYLEQRGARV